MTDQWTIYGIALWLGVLTSISPCPLASNIAAISYVSRRLGSPGYVLLSGLLYTIGRTITYGLIGSLLVSSLLSAPLLSHFLQKYINQLLGPLLILTGMILLEIIPLSFGGSQFGQRLANRFKDSGLLGGLVLGALFALAFCPVSAGLFFGSLLPLAVKAQSPLFIPSLYGIGTGLPVLLFSILVMLGASSVAKAFNSISRFERWMRMATGVIFIAVGVYLALTYTFGLDLSW